LKKKVLVIRFSSIGDIILTTPVLRCLHQSGDYEVHFLTHERYTHVLASNAYIHSIYGFTDFWKCRKWISGQKFDFIIDLHCSLRSHLLSLSLLKRFHGFEKLRWRRWYRTWTKKKLPSDRHIALRFLNALKRWDIQYDGEGLDYFISKNDHHPLIQGDKSTPHVALITGARHFTKTIPLHISKSIIIQYPDIHFHLLGGKNEMESTKPLNQYKNVTNHTGKLNLEQSASVIKQCDFVITTDTAMMHMAAAFQKKIISIWGGTVPEFGFYPFLKNEEGMNISIENKELNCRPCSKSGISKCPKGHFNCMNKISTDDLFSAINRYLAANHFS